MASIPSITQNHMPAYVKLKGPLENNGRYSIAIHLNDLNDSQGWVKRDKNEKKSPNKVIWHSFSSTISSSDQERLIKEKAFDVYLEKESDVVRIHLFIKKAFLDTLSGNITQAIKFERPEKTLSVLHSPCIIENPMPTLQIQDQVLQVFGKNVFLSQIRQMLEQKCHELREIHIIGRNIYFDCSLTLPGINLALGGINIEFLSRNNAPQKIIIDLSGKAGIHGAPIVPSKAANGIHFGETGQDGLLGNNGQGGQPGGNLMIHATKQIKGLNDSNIERIYLSGGRGGDGSNGQDGGDGASGQQGTNARTSILKGDAADSSSGHLDLRVGLKALPGGSGGRGGNAGLGGKGGISGTFIGQNISENLMTTQNGANGSDGKPGMGGKGGAGHPDGLDHLILKGGMLTPQQTRSGYHLVCANSAQDRNIESWRDGTPFQEMVLNNTGKDGNKGQSAEELARPRHEVTKHALNTQLLLESVEKHLSKGGA